MENKYDDSKFFNNYSKMYRSQHGLKGAGEWHVLQKLLPDFKGKKVLDLGCGYGWHCRYAIENGASSVTGVDISMKMIEKAKEINNLSNICYIVSPLEKIDLKRGEYDLVLSSLVFHYIENLENLFQKIFNFLKDKGKFIFSVEHPIFTAYGNQDWFYNQKEEKACWPVDNYFYQGKREAIFLGEKVTKYHHTLTGYVSTLLKAGFVIDNIVEPMPSKEMLKEFPEMKEELRRPMMLIISAQKY